MSRIHEALKKAQEQRGVNYPSGNQQAVEEVEPSPSPVPQQDLVATETLSEPQLPIIQSGRDSLSAEDPRFENIVKNCSKPIWNLDPNAVVFGKSNAPKSSAEQFRTLRSRLAQIRETSSLKTILITSAISGEGKTFVSSNLAQAIARQHDRRVLLIDADLRRSRLHMQLGAPQSPGLSEYLRGEAQEMSIIQHGQKENLCFIPGGSLVSDPSELLSNGKLKDLLERLAPVFDWIIVDSPPCVPVSDSLVLADHCDGVLLVVRAASTPLALAQKARQELQERNVIGVVLNGVKDVQLYRGYYYDGYASSEVETSSSV
jgi:capsular exopolysaccharide synthesis family protein